MFSFSTCCKFVNPEQSDEQRSTYHRQIFYDGHFGVFQTFFQIGVVRTGYLQELHTALTKLTHLGNTIETDAGRMLQIT